MPINSWKEAWETVKDNTGVAIRFHDLRHTCVTRMLEGGVPPIGRRVNPRLESGHHCAYDQALWAHRAARPAPSCGCSRREAAEEIEEEAFEEGEIQQGLQALNANRARHGTSQQALTVSARLLPLMCMYSRQKLVEDFRHLGVLAGDTVMLHASVRAVGDIAGGADEIHLAVKEVLTTEGTLIMYASCPRYYDEVGRGNLTIEQEQEILEKLPPFDPNTARAARDNGILVEFLRTYPGSIVNQHVARFVVLGKHACHLISPQPWNYAFGAGSLLDRFVTLDGKILLLGSDHDNVTFMHYVEHIANIPNKRVARFKVPILEQGKRVWREMEEFDTSGAGVHANWPDHFFSTLVDRYLSSLGYSGKRVGDALSFLFSARALLEFALPIMTALASEPVSKSGK
jgi:aminoglycoside 3-N-acetyltransferase